MILRPASPADVPALAALARESFCHAFAHLYRPEDLASFLAAEKSDSAIAGKVADERCLIQLALDEPGGALAGYCLLEYPSPYASHSEAADPIMLGQLYCAPQRTGAGIGAALLEWALAEARSRGCDAVQLSVWSGNLGAQRFYARYGFAKIADVEFWVGEQCDEEFLFELRL